MYVKAVNSAPAVVFSQKKAFFCPKARMRGVGNPPAENGQNWGFFVFPPCVCGVTVATASKKFGV